MRSLNKINAYVNQVCRQIRWKKVHLRVADEMKKHIFDGRDSYMAQGLDEETATDKSLEDTGAAEEIGSRLDRVHCPKPQWTMLAATAALVMLGLSIRLFVYNDADSADSLSVRLICTGIGLAGLFGAYFADFTLLGKYPKTVYFSIAALFYTAVRISPIVNGAPYYARYSVLLFPLAMAAFIFSERNKGVAGIIKCWLALVLLGALAIAANSISAFLQAALAGMVVLAAAVWKKWFGIKRLNGYLLIISLVTVLGVVFFARMNGMSAYRWNRLAAVVNPSIDPFGAGYFGVMARELLSGAKLFGEGSVPEAYAAILSGSGGTLHTDLMLAALISLFGWVVGGIILGALVFFAVKGLKLCTKQKSGLGFLVSFAVLSTFCVQAIGYVVYNLGFQLVTPISLPLISYGNMAMIVNLILIGFMLSVFRTGEALTDGVCDHYPKLKQTVIELLKKTIYILSKEQNGEG